MKYAAMLVAMAAIAADPANARQAGVSAKQLSSETTRPNLPLHLITGKPTKDTVAILYSGDGGWQDLNERVGRYLRDKGIPVVGVDSLNYFWSERTSTETARDLGRIIDYYTKRLKVQHVFLIGYSFGADIMPASYNRLSREQKSKVRAISLLSLSHKVDYVVSIRGWLGMQTEGKGGNPVDDLKSIRPDMVQCIYGKDDDHDNACPTLKGSGVQVIGMPGGHHFGGDYDKLAQNILANVNGHANK